MNSEFTKPNYPTVLKNNLMRLVGKKLKTMIRYSWWPANESVVECAIKNEEVFSLTAGPLTLTFEDETTIGIGSDPSLNSIILWQENSIGGEICQDAPLASDPELYAIFSNDKKYAERDWDKFIGCELQSFSILKRKEMTLKQSYLPSEIGLILSFSSGEFVLSHGIYATGDDFSVILAEKIPKSTMESVQRISLC